MRGLGQGTGQSDSEYKQLRVQTAGGKHEHLRGGINPLWASWRRQEATCKDGRHPTLATGAIQECTEALHLGPL